MNRQEMIVLIACLILGINSGFCKQLNRQNSSDNMTKEKDEFIESYTKQSTPEENEKGYKEMWIKVSSGARADMVWSICGSNARDRMVPFLAEKLLTEKHEDDRKEIARAFGSCGNKEIVIVSLKKSINDSSDNVRYWVAKSLMMRGEELLTIPILIELVKKNWADGRIGGEFYQYKSKNVTLFVNDHKCQV